VGREVPPLSLALTPTERQHHKTFSLWRSLYSETPTTDPQLALAAVQADIAAFAYLDGSLQLACCALPNITTFLPRTPNDFPSCIGPGLKDQEPSTHSDKQSKCHSEATGEDFAKA
jgi:hypothetical protein